jgi:hypothetical protein
LPARLPDTVVPSSATQRVLSKLSHHARPPHRQTGIPWVYAAESAAVADRALQSDVGVTEAVSDGAADDKFVRYPHVDAPVSPDEENLVESTRRYG